MSTDQPLEIGEQIEAMATPEGDGSLAESMLARSDPILVGIAQLVERGLTQCVQREHRCADGRLLVTGYEQAGAV